MKLLVVSHSCVTAVNQQLYARVSAESGWEIEIVVPSNWRDEYGRNCQVEQWPGFQGKLTAVPVVNRGNIILHAYRCNFARLLRESKPDVVYVNHEPYAVATAQVYAANRLADRRPIGFYSCQNIFKRYPLPFRLSEKSVLKCSSFAFPISADVDEVFRRKGYSGPSTVLPLAVDEELYRRQPDAAKHRARFAGDSGALFGYVGRLVPEKGLLTLVEALAAIRNLHWTFILVGSGPLENELRRRIDAHGLADRVRFTGFVPHAETPKLLSSLDWLILPSETQSNWREQFGRVILEALACGTPVIGSDSGEIPSLIYKTGGGLIFPERNVVHLAATLRKALQNPELSIQLGNTGKAKAIEKFSMMGVVQSFIRTIENVGRKSTPKNDVGSLAASIN